MIFLGTKKKGESGWSVFFYKFLKMEFSGIDYFVIKIPILKA